MLLQYDRIILRLTLTEISFQSGTFVVGQYCLDCLLSMIIRDSTIFPDMSFPLPDPHSALFLCSLVFSFQVPLKCCLQWVSCSLVIKGFCVTLKLSFYPFQAESDTQVPL